MDGPENELAMAAIKKWDYMHFYWSRLIFCNKNSAASSMIHGEMHAGGWVVPSLMVMENGAIGFACTFFSIPAISLWRARSNASHSRREPQHWQKGGGAAFLRWWEASEWRCGGWYGVGFGRRSWLDVCWTLFFLVSGEGEQVSWCLFHIFCDPQPEIPNFWNTAAFSNVTPVQLYSGILDCSDEGSRYQWNKWGESGNWSNCDFGNWRGAGPIC